MGGPSVKDRERTVRRAAETTKQKAASGRHRLTRFYTTKGTSIEMTRRPLEREQVFATQTPDKGLVFKRCVELSHLESKNTK